MDEIELSSIKITETSAGVGPSDQTIVGMNAAETFPPQGGYPPGECPPEEVISDEARKGEEIEEKKKQSKGVSRSHREDCWSCLDTLECLDDCSCDFGENSDCGSCDCGSCDCGDCDCGDCDCDD